MRKFSDMPRRGFKKIELIPAKIWQYRVLLNNEEHRLVVTLKEDWYTVEITFSKALTDSKGNTRNGFAMQGKDLHFLKQSAKSFLSGFGNFTVTQIK